MRIAFVAMSGVRAHNRELAALGLSLPGFVEDPPTWVLVLLVVGWVSMPTILAASLNGPSRRYALIVPASAVSIGLIGMVMAAPQDTVIGWLFITVGILLGGSLGVCFWFRWLPVPRILDEPFGWPRVTLVGLHLALGLVVAGI
jgi:hypothetical protein